MSPNVDKGNCEEVHMSNRSVTDLAVAIAVLMATAGISVEVARGYQQADDPAKNPNPGVVIRQDGLVELQANLVKRIKSVPAGAMKNHGLAGAMGGARVKVITNEPQEIILPIPQLAAGQVPVCYFISTVPADAATEFRLRRRDGGNVVVSVRLAGKKQNVQIAWSSVVLSTPHDVTPDHTSDKPFRAASSCVQSKADELTKLATELWPKSGKTVEFAANIQRHVGKMKKIAWPKSLDAMGILKSGENSICTANANLAAALMRSKGIACRSIAVIPSTGQQLEMHRIVEYSEDSRWIPFDPSSLQTDIPAKSWQNIIMAKTTISDEQTAMKPRMGAMLGCPYGQETELLTPGVILFGQDFFWTLARPLAEFDASEDTARLAAKAWDRYLESGTLSPGQLKAGAAKTVGELSKLLKAK
jgi:hypothetical protein